MSKTLKLILSNILVITIILSTIFPSFSNTIDKNDSINLLRQTLENEREKQATTYESNLTQGDDVVTLIITLEEKCLYELDNQVSTYSEKTKNDISNNILDLQEKYIEEIKKIDSDVVISNRYTNLINGFSIETKYKNKKKIEEIDGIANVEVAQTYTRNTQTASELLQLQQVWNELGYDGENIVVSVIDSGIDATHKDMRISADKQVKITQEDIKSILNTSSDLKGKYYTSKIPYGYNYADDNNEIKDTLTQLVDYGHGMHVAGIIGANCENENEILSHNGVKGVAPECQMLAMKVFSNNPRNQGANEDDIIAAIEDSVKLGADIINMSFCMPAGFQNPSDGQQQAIQRAIDNGVIIVAAAGNAAFSTYPDYPENEIDLKDIGTIGAPGINHDTIQVGSFEGDKRVTYLLNAKQNGNTEKIAYVKSDFDPTVLSGDYDLVYCGLGKKEEISSLNLTGKIALIKRGEIEFKDKKLNVQARGAIGAIIYNTDEEYLDYISTDSSVTIPTIFIKNSDGELLKSLINSNVKISFSGDKTEIENSSKNQISYFSSWGPTPNLDLKPDVVAYGGNIWSTVNDNQYKSMSGTSMASPNTAGVVALMLQHINELNIDTQNKVKLIKTMIMNTCEPQFNEDNILYSPRIQGAGLINPKSALSNEVNVTYNGEPAISLKEISNQVKIPLVITNNGEKDVTYNVKLLGNERLNFTANTVTVKAGETVKISATANPASYKQLNEFFEGIIQFIPVDNSFSKLSIPFMGFYGDWANQQIIDTPKGNDNSVFDLTTLVTAKPSTFGYKTYQLGGDEINPEFFAFNPNDNKSHNNVLPQFSLLRNAKRLIIDITDEKGNVVKILEDKNDVRKEVPIEQQINAKINFDWLWSGGIYDKDLGVQKVIGEGQYYINIKATADFENAKEEVLTFPIKVDKTVPIIKNTAAFTNNDSCILEIEASDVGKYNSSIEHFVFLVNGKVYKDENGSNVFKLNKNENGKYEMLFNFDNSEKELIYKIDIGVTDHADNMQSGLAHIVYTPKSNMILNTNKEKYAVGESIELNYKFKENFDASQIAKYQIALNSFSNVLFETDKQNCSISNLLDDGNYTIIVKALNAENKIIDVNCINALVGNVTSSVNKQLSIEQILNDNYIENGNDFSSSIKVANNSDEAAMITYITALYDNNNRLVDTMAVEKEVKSKKVAILSTNIAIPNNGDYVLKIFVWDSMNGMNNMLKTTDIKEIKMK